MIGVFKNPQKTIQKAVLEYPEIVLEELRGHYYWGCCKCGRCHRVKNIGPDHWYYCDSCKVKWCVGANLFSDWRDENEETWKQNYLYLLDYKEIGPLNFNVPKKEKTGVWERYQVRIKKNKEAPKTKEDIEFPF